MLFRHRQSGARFGSPGRHGGPAQCRRSGCRVRPQSGQRAGARQITLPISPPSCDRNRVRAAQGRCRGFAERWFKPATATPFGQKRHAERRLVQRDARRRTRPHQRRHQVGVENDHFPGVSLAGRGRRLRSSGMSSSSPNFAAGDPGVRPCLTPATAKSLPPRCVARLLRREFTPTSRLRTLSGVR